MSKGFVRLIAVASCLLLACSDDSPTGTDSNVDQVVLRLPHDSLFFGRSVHAVAIATGDSATVAHAQFTWTSSDTSVAVVDSDGNILGVAPGVATISAALENAHDDFTLRVVLQRAGGNVQFSDGSSYYGSIASCAIAAGAMYCRPLPTAQDSMPMYAVMPNATGLSLTSAHTSADAECGMASDGTIYCWGSNNHFVFGRGGSASATQPTTVTTRGVAFSSFSLGGHSTMCGIRTDDTVLHCWGHNDFFQTGREPAAQNDSNVVPVTGNLTARAVSASNFRTCALDLTGAPWCWGGNGSGGLGLGVSTVSGTVHTPLPVFGTHSFVSISVAEIHQCALTAQGDAYCWGQNPGGPLGNGTTTDPADPQPQLVAGNLKFSSIAALGFPNATCGITTTGDLYCWGAFAPAAVSTRIGIRAATPYQLAVGTKFRALSPITNGMCAVTTSGAMLCW